MLLHRSQVAAHIPFFITESSHFFWYTVIIVTGRYVNFLPRAEFK